MAPVCGQRTFAGLRAGASERLARRRRYSETVTRSLLALERINRASSSVTLNVSVAMSNTVLLGVARRQPDGLGSRLVGAKSNEDWTELACSREDRRAPKDEIATRRYAPTGCL